mmetsp:Transcript_57809/g.150647  ORF Transcript_57809/g.150647 Transcript_57809/m.150647 type:complete len:212 (-) Transcript_57809:1194-1829(-)
MPHLHRRLVRHEERIANTRHLGLVEVVDPRVAATSGGHMLRGHVVAEIPILRMRLAIRRLRWQPVHGEHPDCEEATAIVAPEVLGKVIRKCPRRRNSTARHRASLIVHDKVDEAPDKIGAIRQGAQLRQRLGNLRSLALGLLGARPGSHRTEVHASLQPQAILGLCQRRIRADEMCRPQGAEDRVGHLPCLRGVRGQGTRPKAAMHRARYL